MAAQVAARATRGREDEDVPAGGAPGGVGEPRPGGGPGGGGVAAGRREAATVVAGDRGGAYRLGDGRRLPGDEGEAAAVGRPGRLTFGRPAGAERHGLRAVDV